MERRENLLMRKGEKGGCDLYLLESATYTYHTPFPVLEYLAESVATYTYQR